ncbi:hypothetical protein BCR44DRAFT_47659 [Catenaria anguillulae PL171]|uniref:CAF17 C-terminal domain-containing protein n=1 Tax=Catenaria anguillulae PL171 TaxID=765915 RepID=A0A1Y2HKU0_9FUNG|nr:hypothetical protein BCR44DRAFT_47659 [Catenaria anguillulae PL171]
MIMHPTRLLRRPAHFARSLSSSATPTTPQNAYAHLASRQLLLLSGPDSTSFLQGLITNHMPRIARGGDGLYSSMLTPQGRLLFDSFVYPTNRATSHPEYLVDVHGDVVDKVYGHLRRYKLRSKVTIDKVDVGEWRVWQAWGKHTREKVGAQVEKGLGVPEGAMVKRDGQPVADIGCFDPRWDGLGVRVVVPGNVTPNLPESFAQVAESEYVLHRLVHGIAEGTDFCSGTSLPLEMNMDYLNGVDFRKGCYVGQELTIRTYHTGVVRKRIVPVIIDQPTTTTSPVPTSPLAALDRSVSRPLPATQADIVSPDGAGKPVGKWYAGVHNVGVALMRLEHVDPAKEWRVKGEQGEWRVRAYVPDWWPQSTSHKGKENDASQ